MGLKLPTVLIRMGGVGCGRKLKDTCTIRILIILPTGKTGTSGITTSTTDRTQLTLPKIAVPVETRCTVTAIRTDIVSGFTYATG